MGWGLSSAAGGEALSRRGRLEGRLRDLLGAGFDLEDEDVDDGRLDVHRDDGRLAWRCRGGPAIDG